MNFLIAYFKGIWLVLRKIRMWGFLYLINLIFALLVAIPMHNLLERTTGRSLAAERLLSDFDYPVFQDFMNEYGDEVAVVMGQSRVMFAFYLLLSIFLAGGILSIFKNHSQKFSFRDFWGGCTMYFWRMLRLTVYFLIIHIFIFSVFAVFFYAGWLREGLDGLKSEVQLINALKIMLPVYLLVASLFFMVQDYAKIHVVHRNPNWLFFPFWQSFSIAFGNFWKTYPLYLLNALTFAIIFVVFWYFRFSGNMDNMAMIAITFALGQAFIFARIGTKLLNLGSATLMYQSIVEEFPDRETIAQSEIPEETVAEDEPDEAPPPTQDDEDEDKTAKDS